MKKMKVRKLISTDRKKRVRAVDRRNEDCEALEMFMFEEQPFVIPMQPLLNLFRNSNYKQFKRN